MPPRGEANEDMAMDRETVKKVALLGRLALTDEEIDRMTADLSSILGHIDKLAELDTAGVEPMAHAGAPGNVFREDDSRDSLPREKALAASADHDEEFFRVPQVIE